MENDDLTEEAKFVQSLARQVPNWKVNGIDVYPYLPSLEQFTKLIVQECVRAFEAEVDTWKQMDPYQGSMKRQGAKAIKQHFGIDK